MSANLVVPFNFQPAAVSVKTGSYTIPIGRYARVSVSLVGASTFTIGGATALQSTAHSVLASDNLKTVTAGYSGVSGVTATGALFVNADSNNTSAPTAAGSAFNESTSSQVLVHDFWLPEGAVINGSGTWRAVVQEFNNIT